MPTRSARISTSGPIEIDGKPLPAGTYSIWATPDVETLMFAFPMTDADSARLELPWGTTVVPHSIKATNK